MTRDGNENLSRKDLACEIRGNTSKGHDDMNGFMNDSTLYLL